MRWYDLGDCAVILDNMRSIIDRDGKLILTFIFSLSNLLWSSDLVGLGLYLNTFHFALVRMRSLVFFLLVS